jgi:DNA-binding CsgD family transcriptional regulator/pimeloyl-ACP methyl ester carboxylesterase
VNPKVDYATTRDGVRIAFSVFGSGPPLVRVSQVRWDYFRAWWSIPPYRRMVEQFADQRSFIVYDARGTGDSQRDAMNYSLEAQLLDLQAVIEHLGLDDFSLLGWQMGSHAAITAAWRWPDSVDRLVLVNPDANGRDFMNLPEIRARESYRRIGEPVWHEYRSLIAMAFTSGQESDLNPRIVDVMGRAITPEVIRLHADAHGTISVTSLLPEIRMPTLTVISNSSPWSELSQSVARRIQNSTTLVVPGGATLWLDPSSCEAILGFLNQPDQTASPAIEPLSSRELEVLRLLAAGLSNAETAQKLGISENTVLHHVSNILRKMGARNRSHAVSLGYRQHLLP